MAQITRKMVGSMPKMPEVETRLSNTGSPVSIPVSLHIIETIPEKEAAPVCSTIPG